MDQFMKLSFFAPEDAIKVSPPIVKLKLNWAETFPGRRKEI